MLKIKCLLRKSILALPLMMIPLIGVAYCDIDRYLVCTKGWKIAAVPCTLIYKSDTVNYVFITGVGLQPPPAAFPGTNQAYTFFYGGQNMEDRNWNDALVRLSPMHRSVRFTYVGTFSCYSSSYQTGGFEKVPCNTVIMYAPGREENKANC